MFRIILVGFYLLLSGFAIKAQSFLPSDKFLTLSPQVYLEKLNSTSDKIIIDVRTEGEFLKEHIKGARNISYLGSTFAEKAAELDNTKPVFVYCETAHRSPLAARILFNLGFREIYDLQLGFINWKKMKMPVEK